MSASSALVGSTGLVGGTLLGQRRFDLHLHSRNSAELRGGRFGDVVFSAARAEKWRANADPETDARHIDELIDLLGSFTAERLTLISTVDVYGVPEGVDETSPVEIDGLHAYGAGRYRLERAAAALHSSALVVRLPALFGPGLKKNVVFDLIHDNHVERIQPASSFQWYDLGRLTSDLETARGIGASVVNLVTEPVRTAEVVERAFGRPPLGRSDSPIIGYDVRTVHGTAFGASGPYIEEGEGVLTRLAAYVRSAGA